MITGNAAVCGLMGDPVGHSLSPFMQNEIARAMGLDYVYVPCHVSAGDVEAALRGAWALGFAGLNVTVPYKQAVVPYLAELDETVRRIGACNTLVRMDGGGCGPTVREAVRGSGELAACETVRGSGEPTACGAVRGSGEPAACGAVRGSGEPAAHETVQGSGEPAAPDCAATADCEPARGRVRPAPVFFRGYNTDAEGLCRAMAGHGIKIRGRNCLLIGAGGAARAAAYLLVRERAASVHILNRSMERAETLAAHLRGMAAESGTAIPVEVLPLDRWHELVGEDFLAIQTTSVGMYPDVDRAPVEDPAFYKKIRQAVDIVYTPRRTRFMEYVEAAGGVAAGGLDMLIYQGVAALELWEPGLTVPAGLIGQIRAEMEERLPHG